MNERIQELDHELLQYAAKAAGYGISGWDDMVDNYLYVSDPSTPSRRPFAWLPLTDDGDAMRLAVKLKIDIKHYDDHVVGWFDGGYIGTGKIMYGTDPYAATRRAIVRAAAEIGRNMK